MGDFPPDKDPTCTEEGSKSKHCSRCGEKTEVTAIAKIPHTLAHHPETPATTEADGNTEYWDCEVCDKYFADENGTEEITDKSSVVIPKLNNNDNDNSALWIALIIILSVIIVVEISLIDYRAKRNPKAKEKK